MVKITLLLGFKYLKIRNKKNKIHLERGVFEKFTQWPDNLP